MVATSSLQYPIAAAPVNAIGFSWGGTGATAITVDTPTDVLPNTTFYVTGTFVGTPLSMNYSTNGGSSYLPCGTLSMDDKGNYSFQIPGGLAAGTYTIKVQDTLRTGTVGTSGNMFVSTFNPNTLATGVLIWDHDPNDRTLTAVNGYTGAPGLTTIGIVNNIMNKVNNRQFLTAQNGALVAKPINLLRGQGSDSLHSVLAMQPRFTTPLSLYDNTTNCFVGGGLNGSCAGIIRALQNLAPPATMALTCITAVRFDATQGYTFNAGLLGIAIPSNPNRPFIQLTPRNNTSALGGEIVDPAGVVSEGDTATYPPAPGWYVLTTLIGGGTVTTRLNKTAGTPGTASGASLNAMNEFSLGGDGGSTAILNGAPYLYYGRQQLYLGTLTGTDLTGAETMVGHSLGLAI